MCSVHSRPPVAPGRGKVKQPRHPSRRCLTSAGVGTPPAWSCPPPNPLRPCAEDLSAQPAPCNAGWSWLHQPLQCALLSARDDSYCLQVPRGTAVHCTSHCTDCHYKTPASRNVRPTVTCAACHRIQVARNMDLPQQRSTAGTPPTGAGRRRQPPAAARPSCRRSGPRRRSGCASRTSIAPATGPRRSRRCCRGDPYRRVLRRGRSVCIAPASSLGDVVFSPSPTRRPVNRSAWRPHLETAGLARRDQRHRLCAQAMT